MVRRLMYAGLAGLVLVPVVGCTPRTVSPPASAGAPAPAAAAVDPDAILSGMATFLADTERFRFTIDARYDAVQESGQKIEFAEVRDVVVDRPDRLRVDVEQSDGDRQLVVYDGRTIMAYTAPRNVYATAERPGGVDAAIRYFVRDLGMRLPLAVLLTSTLAQEFERRTQALAYVEHTQVGGRSAHHLAGRTETVDYQIWVADDDAPLPLRVILTYKHAPGAPQFRARFSAWDLAPSVGDALFALTPPDGARRISFLAKTPSPEMAP